MGCIFYEVVTKQKAFDNDWRVGLYAISKVPIEIPAIEGHYGKSSAFFSAILSKTLNWEWLRRPTAQSLVFDFVDFRLSLTRHPFSIPTAESTNTETIAPQRPSGSSSPIERANPFANILPSLPKKEQKNTVKKMRGNSEIRIYGRQFPKKTTIDLL